MNKSFHKKQKKGLTIRCQLMLLWKKKDSAGSGKQQKRRSMGRETIRKSSLFSTTATMTRTEGWGVGVGEKRTKVA